MKNFFTLSVIIFLQCLSAKAQNDTLLYENFDVDPTASYVLFPSGNDTGWVDYDFDAQPDQNGRPQNWFWNPVAFGTNDTTGCIFSSSWFTAPAQCLNYLVTPPVYIADANAVLHWRAAPRQTPLYLDGYKIIVSTTDNFEYSYMDTIYTAAEYVSGQASNGGNFSLYTFSPGFIHGEDSTYIEYDGDSARFVGLLRPFSVSLSQFAGQTIYIAFYHDAFDDNLIAVDDILVTGTIPVGIAESHAESNVSVLPNPVSDKLVIKYNLPVSSQVISRVSDMNGRVVKEIPGGFQIKGSQEISISVADLAPGNYDLSIIAGKKVLHSGFTVAR